MCVSLCVFCFVFEEQCVCYLWLSLSFHLHKCSRGRLSAVVQRGGRKLVLKKGLSTFRRYKLEFGPHYLFISILLY